MPLNACRELARLGPETRDVEAVEAAVPTAVDFSTARPTAVALDEVHAIACGRYVSYPGGSNKDLELAEVDRYRRQGRSIFMYWEDQVGDTLGGRVKGQEMARYAAAQVAARGGPTDGGVIYFSVDFDATQAQIQGPIFDWFRGINDVLPLAQVRIYGGYYPVKAVLDAGLASGACQTRAWSGSLWDSRAQLQQYSWVTLSDGSQVDLLRVMAADYGQWDYERGDDDVTTIQEIETLLDRRFPDTAGADTDSLTERIAQRSRQVIAGQAIYGLDVLRRKIDAVAGAVGAQADDERVILAAIAADQATVALTDAQVAELAAQFPQVDPAKIADAVRLDLSQALAT